MSNKYKSFYSILLFSMFFVTSMYAQIGIGTTSPNQYSALDINGEEGGLLMPRVALTSTSSNSPIGSHVEGMTVYNTANTGDVTPGFYYNDGSKWVRAGSSGSGGSTEDAWNLTGNSGVGQNDFLGTTDGNPLIIKTDDEERMRINESGYVGINTGSNLEPNYALTVRSIDYDEEEDDFAIAAFANRGYAIYASSSRDAIRAESPSGRAIHGSSTNFMGVYGVSDRGAGVYGESDRGNAVYAKGKMRVTEEAVFEKNIRVNGESEFGDFVMMADDLLVEGLVTAFGGKNFIIDHPHDPENKFLKHGSIESNEMLNKYRGTATFDSSGQVRIELPSYFDEINRNPSYQLTAVGAAMPNLYIAEEVNNNSFVIAGGISGKKVSWEVTAERNDLHYQRNPELRNMELDKGENRGFYLSPEAYGQPKERGIFTKKKLEREAEEDILDLKEMK